MSIWAHTKSGIAAGFFISTWFSAAFAHEAANPNWKPAPLPMATLISLNGYMCSEVIRSTPLKKADNYKVECKTGSGKSRFVYIYDAKTGKASAQP